MTSPTIDITSSGFRSNPYPTYSVLRQLGRPYWLPHPGPTGGMWLLTRYDHVAQVLKYRCISKHVGGIPQRRCPYDHNLLGQDPPDHSRIRALVLRAFTSERIATLAPVIAKLADELIDDMMSARTADFVGQFAAVLPACVIADVLGVPRSHRTRFYAWSRALLTGPDISNPGTPAFAAAVDALTRYFRELAGARRAVPTGDLISALLHECDAEGSISVDEMLATLILILVAGHETTVNMLANGLWALLGLENSYKRLVADPTAIPDAIEEILRFESPVQRATFRIVTEPLRLGDVTVAHGQQVSAIIGAANRDPEYFDEPDRFDIGRQPNRHMAFGAGIHACIGPALARLEGRICLERLVARVPSLQLVDARADWNTATTAVRGLNSLPVCFA